MSKIIVPRGAPVKRITMDIDKDGNITISAANMVPSSIIKGIQKLDVRPVQPISALEVLFWLSKSVTDGLFQTMKNATPGGVNDGNQKETS